MMNIWIFKNPKAMQYRKDLVIYRLSRFHYLEPAEIAVLLDLPVNNG